VKRTFITQYIDVDTQYHEHSGLDFPYGSDIVMFFPAGEFECIIVDGSNTFIRKEIHHHADEELQINISFLQYVMISTAPKLFIKSLNHQAGHKVKVVFTTL